MYSYDYDCEMLRLYFEEKHFPKWKINELLEQNPFNKDYVIWEKQTLNNNKTFAITLKRNKIINSDTQIQEIAVHEDNSVGIHLSNNVMCTPCSITSDINKVRLFNKLVLVKGIYPNERSFFKKLDKNKIPFITGICTKQYGYYLHILNEYKKMINELKNCELITEQENDQFISIVKTK